ncbi:MAG: ATP phosphoribosyltransferase regulatory subunit [Methylocystis sp.]
MTTDYPTSKISNPEPFVHLAGKNRMRGRITAAKHHQTSNEDKSVTEARSPASRKLNTLLDHFEKAGYGRREPKLLQPARVFLDRSGENFRGRLYLTNDPSGAELCLRPEYTIPICLEYLAQLAPKTAAYSYGGSIFRAPENASFKEGEFIQAGIESFGRLDREAADAEILAVALESAKATGAKNLKVRIGDASLVAAFLDELNLPSVWRRRVVAAHARGLSLKSIFEPVSVINPNVEQSGVRAALSRVDPADARQLVEDLLSIASITAIGGRSAAEIAERFLDQATLTSGEGVPSEKRTLLEAFFAIEDTPDKASNALRRLAREANLNLSEILDSFDTRTGFIAAHELIIEEMIFSTSFARQLDYYTGFLFEAHEPGIKEPIIGGGRYDRLLQTLGATQNIPAVGAAIWVDHLRSAT